MHFPLIVIKHKNQKLEEVLAPFLIDRNAEISEEDYYFEDHTEEVLKEYETGSRITLNNFSSNESTPHKEIYEDVKAFSSNYYGYMSKVINGEEKFGLMVHKKAKIASYEHPGRFDKVLVDKEWNTANSIPTMDLSAPNMREVAKRSLKYLTDADAKILSSKFPALSSKEKIQTAMSILFTHILDANTGEFIEIENVSFSEPDYETVILKKEAGFKKWADTLERLKKPNYDAIILDCHI